MLNVLWIKLKDYKNTLPMMVVMTLLALVLIYVFGRSFDGAELPNVAIVDADGSQASARFAEGLETIEGYYYDLVAYDVGFEGTSKGKYIAMVVIESGFEGTYLDGGGEVSMYKTGESIEHFSLEAGINSFGLRFQIDEQFLQQLPSKLEQMTIEVNQSDLRESLAIQVEKYPVMQVEPSTIGGATTSGYNSLKHSFIGFILFFSMFTMVFGVGSIVEEKECMVWQRQSVAPISMTKVMAGNMTASFLAGMTQLAIMVFASRLLFGIDWGGSMVALLLVLAAFVLAVTSLGLFLSGLVTTMQQLGSFSPIVIVSTSMIGGCMWPLEIITSKPLLFLADLTPQRWAYKGLEAVIVNGGGLSDVSGALGMLMILTLVFFILGMWPYRGRLIRKSKISLATK